MMISLTDDQKTLLDEAVGCARRLASIVPNPENRIRLAEILAHRGILEEALEVLTDVERGGYVTRRLSLGRGKVLLGLERPGDAARVFDAALQRYPTDEEL